MLEQSAKNAEIAEPLERSVSKKIILVQKLELAIAQDINGLLDIVWMYGQCRAATGLDEQGISVVNVDLGPEQCRPGVQQRPFSVRKTD